MKLTRENTFNASRAIPLVVAIVGVGLVSNSTSAPEEENKKQIREAGAHYQKTCMGCHVPPDLRFSTDRAWLGQILETD